MPSIFAFVLCISIGAATNAIAGAQCQGPDGVWYDYTSPMCSGPAATAESRREHNQVPAYFEPDIKFGDLDATWAITLRGVVREKGWQCFTVSAVRSCFWGCDYMVNCDGYTNTYEVTTKGGRVFVEAK